MFVLFSFLLYLIGTSELIDISTWTLGSMLWATFPTHFFYQQSNDKIDLSITTHITKLPNRQTLVTSNLPTFFSAVAREFNCAIQRLLHWQIGRNLMKFFLLLIGWIIVDYWACINICKAPFVHKATQKYQKLLEKSTLKRIYSLWE